MPDSSTPFKDCPKNNKNRNLAGYIGITLKQGITSKNQYRRRDRPELKCSALHEKTGTKSTPLRVLPLERKLGPFRLASTLLIRPSYASIEKKNHSQY